MTRNRRTIEDVLKLHLRSAPKNHLESDAARVLQRLRLQSEQDLDRAASTGARDGAGDGEDTPQRSRSYRAVLSLAAAVVVLLAVGVVYHEILARRAAARLAVEVVDGELYPLLDQKPFEIGQRFNGLEMVRSNSGAILMLADGSQVELRPDSELALESADDGIRIRLSRGSVIITAAKQDAGHLYVQTRDVLVSVVGTVFLVNTGEAGSRVSVIEGEVRVEHAGKSETLVSGEQVATNPLMTVHPVSEELSWSRHSAPHLALMQQSAVPAVAAASPRVEFDAATLKFSGIGGSPLGTVECRGIDGVWSVASDMELNPFPLPARDAATSSTPLGRCVGSAFLRVYLSAAYNVRMDRISGDSPWFLNLEARAEDPKRATKEELRQMLRNLVLDRLEPKVYRETAEGEGYVLRVGKNGVKFKETSDNEDGPFLSIEPPRGLSDQPGMVTQGKFRLARFVSLLSTFAGGPVIDKTDLPGIYELKLTRHNAPPDPAAVGGLRGGRNIPRPEFDPPLSEVLETQLGLRLESMKVPIEYLVLEHIEKPPDN